MRTGRGRGWNLRKGAQDYGKTDWAEAGGRGGRACVKKGFAKSDFNLKHTAESAWKKGEKC